MTQINILLLFCFVSASECIFLADYNAIDNVAYTIVVEDPADVMVSTYINSLIFIYNK